MQLKKYGIISVLILILLLIFIPNLPYTPQTLDTAELIRSAFTLQVPHPPGYPLFVLLFKSVISLIPFGTVFWRAAFFNSILSILVCLFIYSFIRKLSVVALAMILVLATSRIFWKYSELPDVFTLNNLFAVSIICIYLDNSLTRFQKFLPMIFLIGLTHHLSLIFLAPIITHVFLKNIKNKSIWLLSLSGLTIFVTMYSFLLVFNTEALYSWGNLKSIEDVFMHFLRKDYGMFQLVQGESVGSFLKIMKRFLFELTNDLFLIIVFGAVAFSLRVYKKQKIQLQEFVFATCIVGYIFIFFSMSNLQPIGIMAEIIDRFYLLAFIMLFIWSGCQVLHTELNRKASMLMIGLLISNILFNYYKYRQENNFSNNTIVEDYAINLLNQVTKKNTAEKPTLLLTSSDTRRFALEYAQEVLGIKPEIVIVHPTAIAKAWYQDKLKKIGVNVDYDEKIRKTIVVEDDLVFPNIEKFNILTHLKFTNLRRYKLTIMPLGRIIEKGIGLDFYENKPNLLFRSTRVDLNTNTKEYDIYREIWSEYGELRYSQAVGYLTAGNESMARQEFEETLKIVPWFVPALEILCQLEKDKEKLILCNERLNLTKSEYYNYF